jgi:hypothetical protein
MTSRPTAPKPPFAPAFLRGIAHFNAQEFWEAHEAWEELWLASESDLGEFLQGMIQLAAAYHHVRRGTLRGAVRLFDAALRRLDAFPLRFCEIDRSRADEASRRHRSWAADQIAHEEAGLLDILEYPALELLTKSEDFVPPRDPW